MNLLLDNLDQEDRNNRREVYDLEENVRYSLLSRHLVRYRLEEHKSQ